jgi:membrane protease YdiL (CAAX protease family)
VTRSAARFLALAWVVWVLCFVALQRLGTWTPFAFVGLFLAATAISRGIAPRALLRPSFGRAAWGLAGGALMVVGTHVAYRVVVTLSPPVGEATRNLLTLLYVTDFSAGVRALLIVVIASCEEVLFRGLLPHAAGASPRIARRLAGPELVQVVAFAAVYALTTLPLGSPLLVLCALVCGSLWGLMRVASGSLIVPLLAHVVWDLGVLLVWPVST